MRKRRLDDCDADEVARYPILKSAVWSLLNDDLQSRMTRLHADDRVGDAVDEESVLADRRQYADGDPPPLRRRACLAFGDETGSSLDESSDLCKSLPACGRNHAIASALEKSAAERFLDLADLLAERWLADVAGAGGRGDAPQPLDKRGVANLPQSHEGPLDMRFAFGERRAQMLGEKPGHGPWPKGSRGKP